MSTILGGLEPEITAIAPIAGGGGLGNIGSRSMQGGVREAVILRIMAPVFTGTLLEDDGGLKLETIVPDFELHKDTPLGDCAGRQKRRHGGRDQLDNEERGCGYVSEEGTMRTGVASDIANLANIGDFTQAVRASIDGQADLEEEYTCEAACELMKTCTPRTPAAVR